MSQGNRVLDRAGRAQDGPEGAVEDRWRSRWLLPVLLLLGFAAQVAWRLWLVRGIITPAAHADEDGYLIAARVLAGGVGGQTTENSAFQRAGYPLMISPIYWFTQDAFKVYHAVQIFNSVFNALVFPLAYLFAGRVLGVRRVWALVLAFAAALLPGVAFYGQFAMTDAVLTPFALGWLLLMHRWLTATTALGRWIAACCTGLILGALFVIHVRASVVVATHLLAMVALLLLRRFRLPQVLGSLAAMAAMAAIHPVLKNVLAGEITVLTSQPTNRMRESFFTLLGLRRTISDAVGQFWALSVGTWGLAAVGLVVVLWWIVARRRTDVERGIIMAMTLVATIAVALGSAAALPEDHRITYHVYPRYVALFIPVWFLIGAVALIEAKWRRAAALVLSASVLTVGCIGVVLWYAKSKMPKEKFLAFDAPEASFLTGQWTELKVLWATVAALAILALLAVGFQIRKFALDKVTALALIVLHMVALVQITQHITHPMVDGQYATGPQLIRDAGVRPGEIVVESRRIKWYVPFNHSREVYWRRLETFDNYVEEPPAHAQVVIAAWGQPSPYEKDNWDGAKRGWHMVASDPVERWAVWRRN